MQLHTCTCIPIISMHDTSEHCCYTEYSEEVNLHTYSTRTSIQPCKPAFAVSSPQDLP